MARSPFFLPPNSTDINSSDYSALISWGDGQNTVGTVLGGTTGFTVFGSHTYGAMGSYSTTVTVATTDGLTSSGQGQAVIASMGGYTSTSKPIVVPVSQVFSGTVATFTDPNTSDLASIFTASIAWGDGNTTPATVIGSNGSFAVQGTYT